MGWDGAHNLNRKQSIEHRLRGHENDLVKVRCLRHCYRGPAWSGVLYSLWECEYKDGRPTARWCMVTLMKYYSRDGGIWMCKDMEDSMHPFYYGCPKSYVRASTDPVNDDARNWRTKILGEAEVEERWPKTKSP